MVTWIINGMDGFFERYINVCKSEVSLLVVK